MTYPSPKRVKTQIVEFVSLKQLPFGIAQVTFFTTNISNGFYVLYAHRPGSKRVPSISPGQVDFLAEQVTFKTYLPSGKGSKILIR